ncbi:MAG TPA: type II secretion system F family protein [Ideonella sp.]|jgi:tight adherence protein B|uniref:type II secretion system F family protein n=1 Tax=Ideonella sp. TaxID=1929293 RepID=UPI002E3581D7|nr:type II secretion system F family protein [Ideonella sp.]HEX5684663.1 type II secretion system F family protein [Ideonella sp.]
MMLEYALISLMVLGAVMAGLWTLRGAYQNWREQFTENARVSLEDMFLFVDPRALFRANVALFVLLPLFVWLATGALFFAVVAALAGAIFPRVAWVVMRNRRMAKLVLQLPDSLTMMAGSLRAGASLQQALDMVVKESPAPISQEFSLLLREQRLGLALEDSLRGMAQRLKVEDIELFVSAMSIAKEVGGNLSEILDRLSSTLRAKQVMEGKIKALTSQGKLQGIIVGMLPIFLAGILYVMDPASMMPLFVTWYGWGVMAGVFVMLMLGGFFIKKIVTIDV